jgi:hypothetical protein
VTWKQCLWGRGGVTAWALAGLERARACNTTPAVQQDTGGWRHTARQTDRRTVWGRAASLLLFCLFLTFESFLLIDSAVLTSRKRLVLLVIFFFFWLLINWCNPLRHADHQNKTGKVWQEFRHEFFALSFFALGVNNVAHYPRRRCHKQDCPLQALYRHVCVCLTWALFMHAYALTCLFTHSLTPWHYSPDRRKPPLIRFHSLI